MTWPCDSAARLYGWQSKDQIGIKGHPCVVHVREVKTFCIGRVTSGCQDKSGQRYPVQLCGRTIIVRTLSFNVILGYPLPARNSALRQDCDGAPFDPACLDFLGDTKIRERGQSCRPHKDNLYSKRHNRIKMTFSRRKLIVSRLCLASGGISSPQAFAHQPISESRLSENRDRFRICAFE
jgi:hypothetical protein